MFINSLLNLSMHKYLDHKKFSLRDSGIFRHKLNRQPPLTAGFLGCRYNIEVLHNILHVNRIFFNVL